MHASEQQQADFPDVLARRRRFGGSQRTRMAFLSSAAILFAAQSFLAAAILAGQSPTAPASSAAHAHKSAHSRKQLAAAAHPATQPAAQSAAHPGPAAAAAPAQPKPPDWPANDVPADASVVFDSRGLLIVASNSSLAQILKEVGTETGAKVEGIDADQRVFGSYGPGSVRDVLAQILDGSGYNVLMIGDRGEGTPRRIVLTVRTGTISQPAGKAAPNPPGEEDSEAEQEAQEPEPPQSPPSGGAPGVPVRSEQQLLEQRGQQMERPQNGQQPPQN